VAALPLLAGVLAFDSQDRGVLVRVRRRHPPGHGRLRWPAGAGRTQFFFYDGTRLVAIADDAGRVTDEFVYNSLTPVAWRRFERTPDSGVAAWVARFRSRKSELFALETDGRGALTRVSTVAGAPALSLPLDLFAEEPAGYVPGSADPRLRLLGQYADDETGLNYHVARYYLPASRRFLSPDPAGVADSFGFDTSLQLDTTLFAGARPDVWVDPDGAARITYYAVLNRTTGANPQLVVNNRGFNTARWAFVVEDIQAGGDASALGQLRNQYAGNGTSLLFERGGNFIDASRGGTLSADNRSLSWTGATTIVADFLAHYGNTRQLVSVPMFTIDDVDDDNATRLIQFLTQTVGQRAMCTDDPAPWMPPIPFATEEQSITPATADANARPQRLLACGVGSTGTTATALEQRRIRRYEAAAEINETGRINKPCTDGCPGIKYYCTAVRCVARNQPPGGTTPFYVPSYGRSQFTLATLVSELINNWASFTAADLQALGLGAVTLADLQAAQTRGTNAGTHFDGVTAVVATGTNATAWQALTPQAQAAWLTANTPLTEADYENYLEAGGTWNALSAQAQATFTTNTGLGEREYEDMVRMRTVPIRNTNGLDLTNDARAAIVTQAIYSNAPIQTALHGIFTDFDRFTVMAEKLMLANLNAAIAAYPNATEEEHAARVARAHNGGNWRRTLTQLTTSDFANYVKRFIGHTGYRNEGYVSAMRCVEDFGTRVDNVVRPAPNVTSTNGTGVQGVEIAQLVLR
jgi:RHS repeat-associated protein